MRWEIFYNEQTKTLTVVDKPVGHDFYPPDTLGGSLGHLESEERTLVTRESPLFKTWITQRFEMLGIESKIELWDHLPML